MLRCLTPDKPLAREARLSKREEQLVVMASEGLTDREIAQSLNLKPSTVKSYWVGVRQKVGGVNRTVAVVKAMAMIGQPAGASSSLSINLWWRIMCRSAPWIVIVTDEEGFITFISRPPGRGASEYMLGSELAKLAVGRSSLSMSRGLGNLRRGRAHVDCKAVLRISERTYIEVSGRLARVERNGRFGGAIYFVDSIQKCACGKARGTGPPTIMLIENERNL